jgi:hypothetical protein
MPLRFVRFSKKVDYCDDCGFPIWEPVVASKVSSNGSRKHYCHFCAIMFHGVEPSYYRNNNRVPVEWERFEGFWSRLLDKYKIR